MLDADGLAEGEGFEPPVPLLSCSRLSRTAWKRCSRVPQDTPATAFAPYLGSVYSDAEGNLK